MTKKQDCEQSRREFIKVAGLALTATALSGGSETFAISREQPVPAIRKYSLNHKWLFSDRVPANGTSSEFNDSGFTRVTIPHTNRLLPWHGFDDSDYEVVSLYRRHFRVPAGSTGKRIFVDFGGVMTAGTVSINGHELGEYRGGYTPFSFELTDHINWKGDNVLAVVVDSTERKDIPPFGGEIDYLTFGGIYRDVSLRVVPQTFIENVFARPINDLNPERKLQVRVYLEGNGNKPFTGSVTAELVDGARVMASANKKLDNSTESYFEIMLENLGEVEIWDIEKPRLYNVVVRLHRDSVVSDQFEVKTGFREARFTPEGFFLNGKHLKLRGLNRHQTFPYVGQAMPARVQRRDAWILKKQLKCNIVRTSHYPQSPHFLDACDEYGLMVLEEIPGWQHIGDEKWKDLAVDNVKRMVRRDWNHPSIIIWGVRINESHDDHEFYIKTNSAAHELDDMRPTGGIRNNYQSELLEDVFTMNDFQLPLRAPNHPAYLNTEFIGHMYPTKRNDNVERITEHAMRHARVHNQLASDDHYAGGIGWCAFDYNTHSNFCSGDRICYHGVSDIFRIPKHAAGFYMSQCDPAEAVVLEPAFDWARGDRNESFNVAMVSSNCDHLKFYIGQRLVVEVDPDREEFPHLQYPPFVTNLRQGISKGWGDLKIEGYLKGRLVATKTMSGRGVDRQLFVEPDDTELIGDGIDATRVVVRVTDEFGAARPFANSAIMFSIEGPGEIIGENPFALAGGVGAIWVKTKEAAGNIKLTAKHPVIGAKTVSINVKPAPTEASV